MDIKKIISKYFLLGGLYINNIKANTDDYKTLLKSIEKTNDYQTYITDSYINISIEY